MSLNTILATAPLTATGYHLKATGTALGQSLIYDNGTNVGIGTAIPDNTLDVIRGTAGTMGRGVYESASFSFNGDMKFGLYTSAAAGLGGASLLFGATNFTAAGSYPGFELQFSPSATLASNYIRFNSVGRDATGTVVSATSNILCIFQSANVVVGSGTDSGFRFDVNGTTRVTGQLTLGSTITNGTYTYTLPSATGTLALTSALSGYLPLTGGTLTGALGGTTGTFSGQFSIGTTAPSWGAFTNMLNLQSGSIGGTSTTDFRIFQNMYYDGGSYRTRDTGESQRWDMGGGALGIYSAASAAANAVVTPTLKFTLSNTGAATFSSSIMAKGPSNDSFIFQGLSSAGPTIAGFYQNSTAGGWMVLYNSAASQTVQIASNSTSWFNGGNVLIGTTTDAGYKLDVNGTFRATGLATFGSGINTGGVIGGSLYALPQFYLNSVGAYYGLLQNLNSTSWAIAYGTSANSLGTNVITWNTSSQVTINNLAAAGSRAVLADANGVLSAPVSDSSVKENIKSLDYGINDIMKLKPISFEYIESFKNYGQGKQIGNIAQDMQKVIPEAVFTTPSTGKMGINYDQLQGVYIKALQELQLQNEALIKRIEQLENK